jgi:PAS domain S-box-containing protein
MPGAGMFPLKPLHPPQWTLRKKTLLFIGLALVGLVAALYTVSRVVVLHSYADLEEQDIRKNLDRAVSALNDDLATLDQVGTDYSAWDQTYAFIHGGYPNYPTSEFPVEGAVRLRVSGVVLLDTSGRQVFSQMVDLGKRAVVSLPAGLLPHIAPGSFLASLNDPQKKIEGVLLLREGPLLVIAQPIVTSQGKGPVAGTLVMTRTLDDDEVAHLSQVTHLSLSVRRYHDPGMPQDFLRARDAMGENAASFILPLSGDTIAGYQVLKDVYGKPALLLRMVLPRGIYRQGQASLLHFMVLLLAAGLVFAAVALVVLERTVLSRLSALTEGVAEIGAHGDLSRRVSLGGRDELSSLSDTINRMLGALESAQREREEKDARLRLLVEQMPAILWTTDKELRISSAQGRGLSALGVQPEEITGKNIIGRMMEVDPDFVTTGVHQRALAGEPTTVEFPWRGHVFDVHVEPLRAVDGSITGTIGVALDITERKRAEAERQVMFEIIESVNVTANLDELFRRIHTSLKKVLRADNCFVALHDRATGLFQFPFFCDEADSPSPQKGGRSCTAYVFRTGRPMLITQKVFEELVASGEVELVGAPSPAWLGVPLKTPTETIGVLVVQDYRDENAYTRRHAEFLASVGNQIAVAIERKLSETKLEGLRRQNEMILNSAGEGLYGIDLEGRATFVNPAAAAMLGWAVEEIVGQSMHTLIHHSKADWSPYPAAECPIHAALHGATTRHAENEVFWKRDGTNFPVEYTSTPIRDEHGKKVGAVVVFKDISERVQLDEQLRRAQKMEAVGRLAGGVAHDFNNLLMVIKGHSDNLLDQIPESDALRRSVEQIRKAGDRAAALTRQLLAFGRMQVMQAKVLDLNTVVSDLCKMLPRLLGEGVEFVFKADPKLGHVKADPGQLEQVILNLAVNARDAMPRGGKLTIETANVDLSAEYVRLRPTARPGRYVMLAVSDTGHGMDAQTQAQIFEPFFTTKERGKGTGLGLATVYGVVKQSGGFIWVYSEPGMGATFKVYLPLVDEPLEGAHVEVLKDAARPGSETILLAEDEEAVRDLARVFLTKVGYVVLEARNGAEALKIAADHPGPIHLLLTDVIMPKMGGPELADRLAPTRPGIKVLYMSGYAEYAAVEHEIIHSGSAALQKPFALEALARKVREVLDGAVEEAFPSKRIQ